MNLLVVGASHRTAPVDLLEKLAVDSDTVWAMTQRLLAGRYVEEVVVLSTCNRVEIYAAVTGFHGGLVDIADELAELAGMNREALSGHLYIRHETQAVKHAFAVASGLDSLVAGESQILGQLRDAYDTAKESGSVSRMLHELMQQALRVGKRIHSEANVDAAGPSVVSAALDLGEQQWDRELAGSRVLVVGAGAMGALATAATTRRGATSVTIANRDGARAKRLAANHGAATVEWDNLAEAVAQADVVVTATGASRPVLTLETLRDRRDSLLICDLAVPRDVAREVTGLAGVHVVDIETLSQQGRTAPDREYLDAARRILAEEVEAFCGIARAAQVAPTVAALRTRADEVVDAELSRLRRRTPELSDDQRAEVAHTVHRVVRQLLHQPTVRVKQLAEEPGGESYARALRELFALDSPGLESLEGNETAEALRVVPDDSAGNDNTHWTSM
ncbi:glutamyl-tRNA reductase [Stackebrandtia nassauensis]|uniref:Glutamyl-tRNA reductase n=1 Tax=Stackebrandtia nassauensis (strain DSM 44728 / CIP 108903 / NRRL B-16338 / NBRC 102104 / LLR-40K-21) TaxID=446470 RepID=D3PXZ7_STANL|nr:glutamyl-tRNA reductase [Stackebrandtia nassauensis]ADD45326.1 glutamyl-tRNA reductase [Stackebrandtia nassauensis DSM 44728]